MAKETPQTEEGVVKTTDTQNAFKAMEQPEADPMGEAFGEEPAEGLQPSPQEEAPEIDWSGIKGADRLIGRSRQEIADYINQKDYQSGQQSNELGELRKKVREYEKLKQQISGEERKEAPKKPSELEIAMFAEKFNENPYAAMEEFLAPKMKDRIAEEVLSTVTEKLNPLMQEQATAIANRQEFIQFVREHPDYTGVLDAKKNVTVARMMDALMAPEYLGPQAHFEDAYKLALMTRDEPSLFTNTCFLMQRGFGFDEAREWANARQNYVPNAEKKKQQIKEEFQSLSAGSKRAAMKQGATEREPDSFHDAFSYD